jgi:hypothetical protein
LVLDFRARELAKHFWERGIWEIEYRQNVIVKDGTGVMFETHSPPAVLEQARKQPRDQALNADNNPLES